MDERAGCLYFLRKNGEFSDVPCLLTKNGTLTIGSFGADIRLKIICPAIVCTIKVDGKGLATLFTENELVSINSKKVTKPVVLKNDDRIDVAGKIFVYKGQLQIAPPSSSSSRHTIVPVLTKRPSLRTLSPIQEDKKSTRVENTGLKRQREASLTPYHLPKRVRIEQSTPKGGRNSPRTPRTPTTTKKSPVLFKTPGPQSTRKSSQKTPISLTKSAEPERKSTRQSTGWNISSILEDSCATPETNRSSRSLVKEKTPGKKLARRSSSSSIKKSAKTLTKLIEADEQPSPTELQLRPRQSSTSVKGTPDSGTKTLTTNTSKKLSVKYSESPAVSSKSVTISFVEESSTSSFVKESREHFSRSQVGDEKSPKKFSTEELSKILWTSLIESSKKGKVSSQPKSRTSAPNLTALMSKTLDKSQRLSGVSSLVQEKAEKSPQKGSKEIGKSPPKTAAVSVSPKKTPKTPKNDLTTESARRRGRNSQRKSRTSAQNITALRSKTLDKSQRLSGKVANLVQEKAEKSPQKGLKEVGKSPPKTAAVSLSPKKTPRSPKVKKTPKNDLTTESAKKRGRSSQRKSRTSAPNIIALRSKTPNKSQRLSGKVPNLVQEKAEKSPQKGLKEVGKSPPKTAAVSGSAKKMPEPPRVQKSPENHLTNVYALRKSFSPRVQQSPRNDLRKVARASILYKTKPRAVKKVIEKTRKVQKSPKNDLTEVHGLRRLFSPKTQKSPKNDLSKVAGVSRLFKLQPRGKKTAVKKTPKIQKSPRNDLTKVSGLRRIFSPKVQKSPKNDLTRVAGVSRLYKLQPRGKKTAVKKTPKIQKSPKNDLTKVQGLRKIFSPKVQKSPKNDLTRVAGISRVFKVQPRALEKVIKKPPRVQKSPKNDLTNVYGLRNLLSPRRQKSPKNDLSKVSGVARLYKLQPRALKKVVRITRKVQKSPRNDLREVAGLRNLLSPKTQKSPKNDLSNVSGVKELFRRNANEKLFDELVEKKLLRTYTRKSFPPSPSTRQTESGRQSLSTEIHLSKYVKDWVGKLHEKSVNQAEAVVKKRQRSQNSEPDESQERRPKRGRAVKAGDEELNEGRPSRGSKNIQSKDSKINKEASAKKERPLTRTADTEEKKRTRGRQKAKEDEGKDELSPRRGRSANFQNEETEKVDEKKPARGRKNTEEVESSPKRSRRGKIQNKETEEIEVKKSTRGQKKVKTDEDENESSPRRGRSANLQSEEVEETQNKKSARGRKNVKTDESENESSPRRGRRAKVQNEKNAEIEVKKSTRGQKKVKTDEDENESSPRRGRSANLQSEEVEETQKKKSTRGRKNVKTDEYENESSPRRGRRAKVQNDKTEDVTEKKSTGREKKDLEPPPSTPRRRRSAKSQDQATEEKRSTRNSKNANKEEVESTPRKGRNARKQTKQNTEKEDEKASAAPKTRGRKPKVQVASEDKDDATKAATTKRGRKKETPKKSPKRKLVEEESEGDQPLRKRRARRLLDAQDVDLVLETESPRTRRAKQETKENNAEKPKTRTTRKTRKDNLPDENTVTPEIRTTRSRKNIKYF